MCTNKGFTCNCHKIYYFMVELPLRLCLLLQSSNEQLRALLYMHLRDILLLSQICNFRPFYIHCIERSTHTKKLAKVQKKNLHFSYECMRLKNWLDFAKYVGNLSTQTKVIYFHAKLFEYFCLFVLLC